MGICCVACVLSPPSNAEEGGHTRARGPAADRLSARRNASQRDDKRAEHTTRTPSRSTASQDTSALPYPALNSTSALNISSSRCSRHCVCTNGAYLPIVRTESLPFWTTSSVRDRDANVAVVASPTIVAIISCCDYDAQRGISAWCS